MLKETNNTTNSFPNLKVIDLDSSFFFGVARDMTDEERLDAVKHGRYDNCPMSVLGITDGMAAVDGEALAQLFASSPKLFKALQDLLPITIELMDEAFERGDSAYPSGNISELIYAQAAISEASTF